MRHAFFLVALLFQLTVAAQGRQLVMAEYFVDIDPGAGMATSMTAADGAFDQALEQALTTALAAAAPGHHLVGVRMKGQDGAWSNTFRTVVYQNELAPARALRVQQAEAFIDNDPGAGSGLQLVALDGNLEQALEVVLATDIPLTPGPHVIGVRVRDAIGDWSNVFRTVVYYNGLIAPRTPAVQLAEFYVDEDPGAGSASPLVAFDGALDEALEMAIIEGGTLSFGHHTLGVRVQGGDGQWSNTFRSAIFQDGSNGARAPHIQQAEYFLGSDPGPGNAAALIAQDGGFDEALEAVMGSDVSPNGGPTVIGVRFQGADGSWSNTFRSVVVVQQTASVKVSVEDELTYFDPNSPLVAGAHVVISDTSTAAVYADGFSNTSGVFSASGLPAGTHHITVSEPVHFTYNGTISLIPGDTLDARIFLLRAPDSDNDGYYAQYDCNDTDPTINPGAPEICDDGVDNDCDGVVDEVLPCFNNPNNYVPWNEFGNNGIIEDEMGPGSDAMHTSVLQPDGKLIIAGTGSDGLSNHVSLIRIDTAAGALDPTFGVNGEATVIFEQRTRLQGIALQPDGRIIGVGMIAPGNGGGDQWAGVFRLLADGSVDPSFSSDGYHRMPLAGDPGDFVAAFTTDSTITCLGTNSGGKLVAVRFLYDGSLDLTFGNSGISFLALPNWALHYEATAIQLASGAYLVATIWCDPNIPGCYSFGLGKFLSDGTPDGSFGSNGVQATGISARAGDALGLAELPDGKILLGGSRGGLLLARLLANGNIDNSFGTNGVSIVPDAGDGKGSRFVVLPGGQTFQFARYNGAGGAVLRNANGQLVTSYGNNGFLALGGYSLTAGHLLPNDRIIAMGYAASVSGYTLAGMMPDECPLDPLKSAPGVCGCGNPDTDTDGDGIADCADSCPLVPGQVGSACDDGDPDTNLSQLNASCTCEAVPEIGDYRSVASGVWAAPQSWEVYTGSAFVPASVPPDVSSGWITIRNGHSITIASPVTVDQVVVRSGGALAIQSTLNLNDGPGADLRVKGTLTSASTLNGPGSVTIRQGGVYSFTSSTFSISSVVNIEAGGTMNKNGTTSQSLNFSGVINNAGTFNMNGGWISGSQSGVTTINNLTGGVININGWFSTTIGWLTVNFFNAGTFNRNPAVLSTFPMSGRIRNLDGGVVNVNAGTLQWGPFGLTPDLTYQRGRFNVAPGATLNVSSNFGFQFLGTEINNNGALGAAETFFVGNGPQALNGNGVTPRLTINNPNGVTLGGTQTITSSLTLSNGTITLGNNDLIVDGASLTGGSESSHVITNGTGSLRRTVPAGGSSYFPVGTSTSFAPATINLDGSGTTDAYRVRVNNGVSTTYDTNDAPTGTAITSAALQHTWTVRDMVSGGTNASINLQWNAQDEAQGFTRNACRMARNDGNGWDTVSDAAATGTGPFMLQRNGITDLGVFTVLGGIMDLCPNGPEPGTPCDDGSACTINDLIGVDCQCSGTPTNCDDGNPCTLDLCDPQLGCQHLPVPDGTACGAAAQCIAGACTTIVLDTDGDGTIDANDCAPNDPMIHPGAVEICNSLDDDCDGHVDLVNALDFDGTNDHIALPAASFTGPWTAITVEAWIRSDGATGDFQAIFSSSTQSFVHLQTHVGGNNAVYTDQGTVLLPILPLPPTGEWHHVALTSRSGATVLYLDGAPIGSSSNNYSIITPPPALFIGQGFQGGRNFSGQLRDLRVWNVERSAAQIQADMIGTPAASPGLMFNMPLNDGLPGADNSALTATADISGNDLDGALVNFQLNGNASNWIGIPLAAETCNGIDDDCDGQVDEGFQTHYIDNDGDGYGDPGAPASCGTAGSVPNALDCDDTAPTVYTGAPDVCDGLDNDCNGSVDHLIMSGLSLYLPFTGNADDLSGNGHNGTLFNTTPVSGHTGTANTAFAFNGSSARIEVADHPDLRPASFTLSTWIYYDAVPGGVQCIVNKPLCGGYSDSYGIWFEGGMLRAGWGYGPNSLDSHGYAAPAAGAWHHMALSLDDNANNASIYVDNILMGTYPVTQSIVYDNTPLVIGAEYENCALSFHFNGRVDETVLFDRALNATEITQLFNSGPIGYPHEVCDGLDNDCNGQIDDGVGAFYYTDADGDGYGDPASAIQACTQPPNTVAQGGDCDPNDAGVNPGEQELCDGVDNNCDGAIDEQVVLRFDGSDDHVAVGSWFTEQNFTIELWLKPGATQNQYANIVDNNHSFNVRWVCQQDGSIANQYYWSVAAGGSIATVTFTLQPDAWQHLALVKGPNEIAVYVNGALIGTSAVSGSITGLGSGDLVRIGQWGGGGRAWNGSVHDVRFWNSELSQAQILAAIQQTIVSPTPGLLANYRMNDGVANGNNIGLTTVADASGNAHHGQFVGFALNGTNSNFISTGIDADNDGIADCNDSCPLDPLKTSPGICGCGTPDTDTDGDGTADCNDACPNDPLKTDAGSCGCGAPETDTDNDGTADCIDACPNDPLKTAAGICGCGTPDTDSDNDGTADCNDGCPNDPLKTLPGSCGCGVVDVPATWYADSDGDGFGDAANSLPGLACLQPPGHVANSLDCDDNDAAINPLAYDACPDGIDNNCNGLIDEQAVLIGDVCSSSIGSCQPGVWGCVNNVLTCVGGVLPGPEICSDGLDNDCDGEVDEQGPDTQPLTWFVDADGDGHGDPAPTLIVLSCDLQLGYALVGDDCDDGDPTIHPGATEVCNGVDEDCDGQVDEGTVLTWYFDEDGDGFGDDDNTLLSCTQPNGYEAQPGDCDDLIPTTYPGAPETCNGADDDCDGLVDGDDPSAVLTVWYLDNDGDGYGITGITASACDPPPGYASQPGDCNDNDADVHPNAPDVCVNGIDNNCNGAIDEGSSMLGQPCSAGACVPASWDCVGGSLTCVTGTGPAVEICGDGVDNDCDGAIDEEDPNSVPQTWYMDGDNDGYGDTDQSTQSCFSVAGHVLAGGDCNDANPAIHPGVMDICDGIDNNCDGLVDVGTGSTWYLDGDGDGFAAGAISIIACAPPVGYTSALGDCDDNNASIHPMAYDACPDGIDNNCNGLVDEQAAMIGQPCGSSVGLCTLGTWTCVNNELTCMGGISPGLEICSDGVDNDCDGQVDEITPETVPLTWYVDTDGDGFGNPDTSLAVHSCDPQPGYAVSPGDCNDNVAAVNPTAAEVCNGFDDDCDGQVDEGCACSPADIALMLVGTQPTQACIQDCYGGQSNSYVFCLTNCYVQAGYSSTCATCVVTYQLCTATSCPECLTDPNSAACIQCRQTSGCDAAFMAYSGLQDADGDGEFAPFDCNDNNAAVNSYGVEGCVVDGLDNDCDGQVDEDALVDADNDGYTLCDGDCNDTDDTVNPAGVEVCDGIDNDCDGLVDDGFPVHYRDEDGDGFGDPNALGACGAVGSVPNNLDCDDTDPTIYTGAPELCDGLDNDCNGIVDDNLSEDLDGDGFTPCNGDCDDQDPTVFPGAPELCDGLDNDCNGSIEPQLYADEDLDGYGEAGSPVPCGSPGSTNQLDCDDTDPLVTLAPLWYPDVDGDGYGVYSVAISACAQPTGYAGNSFDCNDNDALVFPGQGCTECSPADLALMASDPLVTSPSLQCLQDCSNTTDQQQCISDCIADNGLSGQCADCFSAYQFCLQASCPICQEQPDSPACIACQANSGCKEAFMACSGLEDADDDGYFAPFDCNDLNAAVHPDAPELCDELDNDCDGTVDEFCDVRIAVKVMLDGPYDAATGLMNDGMRALGLVPTAEPYTGLGYTYVGGGGESTSPSVLAAIGNDAVVDWVLLELRDANDPSTVIASRSALLQRDGDVVETDGAGPPSMPIGTGSYYVAVRHRNHLGAMTAGTVFLTPTSLDVDFTRSSTATFGVAACRVDGPLQMLWCGDVTFDGVVRYTGANNDRDPILISIGSVVPTNVVGGFGQEDVNMDGVFKYVGEGNDRDPILQTIGGTVPTAARVQQLP